VKIPSADRAVVPEGKLSGYLLSDGHPIGRLKAAFFRSMGYSQAAPESLSDALLRHLENEVTNRIDTEFGTKYEIRAELQGPNGVSRMVVSVWIVLHKEDYPRFVPAYPGD